MKSIDILSRDTLYAEMLALELQGAGLNAHVGKSAAPDLIICDLDTSEAVKGPFVLSFSREKEADLPRPFDTEMFVARVKEILSGSDKESKEEKKSGLYVSPYERYALYNEEHIELSELEHRLILYLYNNKRASISQLSREVFGEEDNPNLVRVYINYLREKIDNRFKVKLITTKRGFGYILGEE